MNKLKALLSSRRFYAALAGLIAVFTDGFGIPLAAENLDLLIGLIATWIVGDSIAKTQ